MEIFGETRVKHSGKLLRHFAPKCTDLHLYLICHNSPEPPETAVFPAISHKIKCGAGGDGCLIVGTLYLWGFGVGFGVYHFIFGETNFYLSGVIRLRSSATPWGNVVPEE
jgi:hypothetical protein